LLYRDGREVEKMKCRAIFAIALVCAALAACRTAPLYEPTRRALVTAEEDEERTIVGQPVSGTSIAQLGTGMTYAEALKIMGKPSAERVNNTGKAWIPTYNGTDRWRHYLAYKPQPFVEQQRQQERERALREQNERTVDQRPQAAPPAPVHAFPNPSPRASASTACCWSASSPKPSNGPLLICRPRRQRFTHRPLPRHAGVNVVLARAQQAVIARGFVTTRVLAAPQDLSTGTLTLSLVPGRIAAIRTTADSSSTLLGSSALLATAIPARPGDLLNLRDIEQGLENLKRAPTAEADIQIEPSTAPNAKPGDSDLVVKYVQAKKWRVTLSLDDSGTEATGRYQSGATLSLDNPFGLNDLFYVSANHSINNHVFGDRAYGTEGQTVHYSLPYGYWLLGFTASNSQYHQSVAGLNQDYVYAGKSNNAEVKLSRLVYRDQSRKTTVASRAGAASRATYRRHRGRGAAPRGRRLGAQPEPQGVHRRSHARRHAGLQARHGRLRFAHGRVRPKKNSAKAPRA
jgi:hemolysin activation/secretion protein